LIISYWQGRNPAMSLPIEELLAQLDLADAARIDLDALFRVLRSVAREAPVDTLPELQVALLFLTKVGICHIVDVSDALARIRSSLFASEPAPETGAAEGESHD
jgi:hypothetical protein